LEPLSINEIDDRIKELTDFVRPEKADEIQRQYDYVKSEVKDPKQKKRLLGLILIDYGGKAFIKEKFKK